MRRRLLVLLGLLVLLLPSRPAAARLRDRTLLLDVMVDGYAIGLIGEFHQRAGLLFITRKELAELGLRLPAAAAAGARGGEVPLDHLAGFSYRIDEAKQVIHITASAAYLKPNLLGAAAPAAAATLPAQVGFGAVLNYNIDATTLFGAGSAPQTIGEALLDARLFSPWGVGGTTLVATLGAQGNTAPLVRLDSSYTYSDPNTLRRVRVGDVITGGLAWTNPIRIGGVQIGTDFAIRPDLVTFPVPSVSGQVAVPSSVDVLVNGAQVLSREVPPGPFEIQQLPIVTGAGDVVVVTRSADGQETRQTLPIYSSNLLLAPGLQAYSAELGEVRLNYGSPEDTYRGDAGSFSYRRGLLRWLTLEAHGEGAISARLPDGRIGEGGGMAGGGAVLAFGRLGVLALDGAGSQFGQHSGTLASAAFERSGQMVSLSASVRTAGRGFRDVAASYGDAPPLLQLNASVGLALGPIGSFGCAFIATQREAFRQAVLQDYANASLTPSSAFGLNQLATPQTARSSLLSVSYSRGLFGGAALYATGFTELAGTHGSGATIGITIPFGRRGAIGISAQTQSGSGGSSGSGLDGSIGASQSANTIGDFGWRALAESGEQSRQMVLGEYKSPVAIFDAGVDRIAGQTTLRASAQGAIASAGGGVFASNPINNSFAVVDTDHVAGVTVLQENRPLGRTDASGLMLVPDLRAYEANRLAINAADVPVDVTIGQTTQMVRPQDRSGVVVHFPIHAAHGAVVRLVDASGVPIAVGSIARLAAATGHPLEIGYDGVAFMTGLLPHDTVIVTLANGKRCEGHFDYHPVARALPHIGPVRCLKVAA